MEGNCKHDGFLFRNPGDKYGITKICGDCDELVICQPLEVEEKEDKLLTWRNAFGVLQRNHQAKFHVASVVKKCLK